MITRFLRDNGAPRLASRDVVSSYSRVARILAYIHGSFSAVVLRSNNKKLLAILLLAFFLHFFRLEYPNAYVFDEVYHGFTAKEYLKGSKEAWEWWTTPPPGVAFEWTHPPLAKEMMTASMFLVSSTDAWGWRVPGAILGVISIFLIYKIGEKIFNKNTGLIAALLFSLDGLNFVQSRTGMNDIYVVTFSLASILFLLNKRFFLSALFVGLAFASKWSALYLIGLNSILLFYFFLNQQLSKKNLIKAVFFMALLIPLIYLISYLPFFYLGHTFDQFINFEALFKCQLYRAPEYFQNGSFTCPHPYTLQNQMLNYHVNLVATHDYSSPAWSWPLNLFPVWYFVEYHKNGNISNIFASGNPVLFWMGIGAIIISLYDFIFSFFKNTEKEISHKVNDSGFNLRDRDRLLIVLLGYSVFWLPWLFSPRIMFLYHYSPSVPFLSLILGHQISLMLKARGSRTVGITVLVLIVIGFILVYPMLTGIPLPKNYLVKFFDINLTKNPFGQ